MVLSVSAVSMTNHVASAAGGDAKPTDDQVAVAKLKADIGTPPADGIIDIGDLPDGIIDIGDLPGGIIDVGDLPDGILDIGDLPGGIIDIGDLPDGVVRYTSAGGDTFDLSPPQ